MSGAKFVTGSAAFAAWRDDLTSGVKLVTYQLGAGDLAGIPFGPGRVLLLGGPPNAGKTVFVMQAVFDMLRLTPDVRAVVLNVEMPPDALLGRQLARFSGVAASTIRDRSFTDADRGKLSAGYTAMAPLCERVAFVGAPFTLENAVRTAHEFGAKVLVLDYIQRIKPPGPAAGEKRQQLESTMSAVRQLADAGLAVIVVAAVGRSKDSRGRNSYSNLTLASFRESSELEYGADDAYILVPPDQPNDPVTLKHVKSRYGETRDVTLTFDRRLLRMIPSTIGAAPITRVAAPTPAPTPALTLNPTPTTTNGVSP